jgi:hypothetical protein
VRKSSLGGDGLEWQIAPVNRISNGPADGPLLAGRFTQLVASDEVGQFFRNALPEHAQAVNFRGRRFRATPLAVWCRHRITYRGSGTS